MHQCKHLWPANRGTNHYTLFRQYRMQPWVWYSFPMLRVSFHSCGFNWMQLHHFTKCNYYFPTPRSMQGHNICSSMNIMHEIKYACNSKVFINNAWVLSDTWQKLLWNKVLLVKTCPPRQWHEVIVLASCYKILEFTELYSVAWCSFIRVQIA